MKYWLLFLAIPSMVFSFVPSSQQNCSTTDLRNETIGNVRNQHNISWCYAFTGADMLAHEFNKTERISAADMAIGYNESQIGLFVRWLDLNILNRNNPILRYMSHQNGFNKISIEHTFKDGWCPERIFPSESWTKLSRTKNGWVESQVLLDQAMLEISALHDIKDSLTLQNIPYYYSFKNIDAAVFMQIIKKNWMSDIYSALRQTICRNDRHPFEENRQVTMALKNPYIFSLISTQLDNGHLVGLDYDSRILKDSTTDGVKMSELHTSSIVSRRWNETLNLCEFLIRDSHGQVCDNRYDQSYECVSGNIWLNENQIYKSMTSIVYMNL